MEGNFKPVVKPQRILNPKVQDVVKAEIVKLIDSGLIYTISDSPWVSPIHAIPKKWGITVITNENNELVPTRIVTGWRVCIDYRKHNDATSKDHFPLPFIKKMLERLSGNEYYCFLDGFSGYFQIPLAPKDQEKTTFTCPYRTFTYRRMPFGLCNALATFQRCIILGHKISKSGIEVDCAKIDVIAKLPYLTNVKGVKSFLMQAGFYQRFIKDFSKIARPMTQLLIKDAKFIFSNECLKAFNIFKNKLTSAPIIIALNWNVDFELIKTMNDAQEHYTTTKKELLCNLPGSGFTFLLAVATFFTGSGKFFCQWELYNW
nr:DNA-directed DNA polymerase [Tanacetum cinerariifolium]